MARWQSAGKRVLPSLLRRLPAREGRRPKVDYRYPCLQIDDPSPPMIREALLAQACTLAYVEEEPTRLAVPDGRAFVVAEYMARGQPEAFITGREFAIVRADGSTQLSLPPVWGQKLLGLAWTTIHPLARYLAGTFPPQSLILYAPRDSLELAVAWKVLQAAYWFARGEIEGQPLPDSTW
jgi:hypothetical protein